MDGATAGARAGASKRWSLEWGSATIYKGREEGLR